MKARGTPRTAYTRGRETGNVGGNADYTPSHDSGQGRSFYFPSWQSEHRAGGAILLAQDGGYANAPATERQCREGVGEREARADSNI